MTSDIGIPKDLTRLTKEELQKLRVELQAGFTTARRATPIDVPLLENFVEAHRAATAELKGRPEPPAPRPRLIGIRPPWSKEKRLLR